MRCRYNGEHIVLLIQSNSLGEVPTTRLVAGARAAATLVTALGEFDTAWLGGALSTSQSLASEGLRFKVYGQLF